jgi:hypothetical protein
VSGMSAVDASRPGRPGGRPLRGRVLWSRRARAGIPGRLRRTDPTVPRSGRALPRPGRIACRGCLPWTRGVSGRPGGRPLRGRVPRWRPAGRRAPFLEAAELCLGRGRFACRRRRRVEASASRPTGRSAASKKGPEGAPTLGSHRSSKRPSSASAGGGSRVGDVAVWRRARFRPTGRSAASRNGSRSRHARAPFPAAFAESDPHRSSKRPSSASAGGGSRVGDVCRRREAFPADREVGRFEELGRVACRRRRRGREALPAAGASPN